MHLLFSLKNYLSKLLFLLIAFFFSLLFSMFFSFKSQFMVLIFYYLIIYSVHFSKWPLPRFISSFPLVLLASEVFWLLFLFLNSSLPSLSEFKLLFSPTFSASFLSASDLINDFYQKIRLPLLLFSVNFQNFLLIKFYYFC